jgi:hypothetical protein
MPAETSYKVEKKEQIRKLSPSFEPLTYYRIWATSTKGTYFSIEVSDAELANAPKLLETKAKQLDAI